VRLVGVDYLSVGSAETHRTLLGAGVVVIEGLDLRRAPAGPCRLICLPLRLEGADGAPARVLLETEGR
jgi:arylformamidase